MTDEELFKKLLQLQAREDTTGTAGDLEGEAATFVDNETSDGENVFEKISDIFTGTKSTEYPSLPEIGSADAGSAGANIKVAAGLLLTPNQKSQAEIIQAAVPGSAIREDKYGNVIVNMTDGKNF